MSAAVTNWLKENCAAHRARRTHPHLYQLPTAPLIRAESETLATDALNEKAHCYESIGFRTSLNTLET